MLTAEMSPLVYCFLHIKEDCNAYRHGTVELCTGVDAFPEVWLFYGTPYMYLPGSCPGSEGVQGAASYRAGGCQLQAHLW